MALIFNNGILGALFGDNVSGFNGDSPNAENFLPIDIVFEESEVQRMIVTNRPTQAGASYSDNIILLPKNYTVDGFFKSDLIGDTWRDKKEILDELVRAREPFDIVNHFGVVADVFFTEITSIADGEFNNVLKFTAGLQQIPIIEAETKTTPAEAFKEPSKGAPQQATGKVQGEATSASESSLLLSIFGS